MNEDMTPEELVIFQLLHLRDRLSDPRTKVILTCSSGIVRLDGTEAYRTTLLDLANVLKRDLSVKDFSGVPS